jgi:hypothetical protein
MGGEGSVSVQGWYQLMCEDVLGLLGKEQVIL